MHAAAINVWVFVCRCLWHSDVKWVLTLVNKRVIPIILEKTLPVRKFIASQACYLGHHRVPIGCVFFTRIEAGRHYIHKDVDCKIEHML